MKLTEAMRAKLQSAKFGLPSERSYNAKSHAAKMHKKGKLSPAAKAKANKAMKKKDAKMDKMMGVSE